MNDWDQWKKDATKRRFYIMSLEMKALSEKADTLRYEIEKWQENFGSIAAHLHSLSNCARDLHLRASEEFFSEDKKDLVT